MFEVATRIESQSIPVNVVSVRFKLIDYIFLIAQTFRING